MISKCFCGPTLLQCSEAVQWESTESLPTLVLIFNRDKPSVICRADNFSNSPVYSYKTLDYGLKREKWFLILVFYIKFFDSSINSFPLFLNFNPKHHFCIFAFDLVVPFVLCFWSPFGPMIPNWYTWVNTEHSHCRTALSDASQELAKRKVDSYYFFSFCPFPFSIGWRASMRFHLNQWHSKLTMPSQPSHAKTSARMNRTELIAILFA